MFLMCSVDLREPGIHTRSKVGGDLSSGRDVILRDMNGNNGTSETKIREIQLRVSNWTGAWPLWAWPVEREGLKNIGSVAFV